MKSQDLIHKIIDHLSYLSRKVDMHNSLGFFDVNKVAEYFYADFLNIVFGYNLKNLNNIEKNAKAIDLYDEINGIAIQVTSESEISKYRETVKKFVDSKLNEKYPTLIILLITRKKRKHNTKTINEDGFHFDINKSVWDINEEILKKLINKNVVDLENILDFLEKNLTAKERDKEMSTTQNFNFNHSNQNPNINTGSGIQNITQNITQHNDTIDINQAKNLFDRGMFPAAKEMFKKIVANKPDDKEACMYYLLSSLSNINLRNLSDSSINHIYAMIEKFQDDDFFKLLWLIIFYEHSDIHGLAHQKNKLFNEMQLNSNFRIHDKERKLLNGLNITSTKASILLQ